MRRGRRTRLVVAITATQQQRITVNRNDARREVKTINLEFLRGNPTCVSIMGIRKIIASLNAVIFITQYSQYV